MNKSKLEKQGERFEELMNEALTEEKIRHFSKEKTLLLKTKIPYLYTNK